MEKYFKIEYFYIILVLIWHPFQVFVFNIDAAGRSITAFTLIVVLVMIYKKRFFNSTLKKPLSIWGIWILYSLLNIAINGYGYDIPAFAFLTNLIVPYIIMVTISSIRKKDQKILVNVLIFAMYLSLLIILVFDGTKGSNGRLGDTINSNTIGIMAVTLLMFIYLKHFNKDLAFWKLILMSIIPVLTIILTGSRTAFGGLILLLLTHIIVSRTKNLERNLYKISIMAMFLIFSILYVLQNTGLGERLMSTTDQGEEIKLDTGNVFFDNFGDRGYFYYYGWLLFKENPVLGIGQGNFQFFNEAELVQHSEYMAELTELGAIGFSIFIFFFFSILRSLYKIKIVSNKIKPFQIYAAFIIIVLIMMTAIPLYKKYYLFAIIGLVIAYINNEHKSENERRNLQNYLKKL